MTERSIRALGRFVADEALRKVTENSGARAVLRVSGFDRPTVAEALLRTAQRLSEAPGRHVVVKVGTSEPIKGVPVDYLLDPQDQLTKWRNSGQGTAVLLFEWGQSPDAQGLAAMNALDDAMILGDYRDTANERGFDRFMAEAWREAGGIGGVPALMATSLQEIWCAVTEEEPRSLHRWAAFLVETAQKVAAAQVHTPDTVHREISAALPALDLFPDRGLSLRTTPLPTRIKKNVSVSGFKQPTGKEITEDDLIDRITTTEFTEESLNHIGTDSEIAKARMRSLILSLNRSGSTPQDSRQLRREQDLTLWLEIFEQKSKKIGLGQQVRQEIEKTRAERVGEFDAMMIEDALDHGDQESAQRFLDEAPASGAEPLADLLTKRSRRKVEKLAFPDSQLVQDPLRALLRELTYFSDEEEGSVVVGLEGSQEAGRWSRWLFAFLYARTLRDVQESTGLRLTLEVKDYLLDLTKPPLPEEDEPFDPTIEWSALRILVEMDGAAQRRFRWDPLGIPGQIALAALIHGWRTPPGHATNLTFDTFLQKFSDPRQWQADEPGPIPASHFAGRLERLKLDHFERFSDGLDAGNINDYVREWEGELREARTALVPDNAPNADLEAVVLTDVVGLADHRMMMLATHPLKMRWLAKNYAEAGDSLKTALNKMGGLSLNQENEDLFFDAVDRISPHGTPAVLVGPGGTIAIPMRESAGHEEYAPVRHGGNESKEWLSSVDETAIDEMVRVITDYLTTYPHKLDGLRVLLLDRNGDPVLPMRVAKQVRSKNPRLKVDLVVLAPQATHHEIIQGFDLHFSGAEMSEDSFLPDVQLILQAWEPDQEADLSGLENTIDLALAPALFGTQTSIRESTKKESLSGSFNPWKHPASHNLAQTSENVVRALLPETADETLESWSTLCVRYDRRSPVSRESVDGIDYFEMQVQFDQHLNLFATLHRVAHWVVTLDSFIGREQIDALRNRPDVILVKPSVGKNESYTLIVSSQTGRQFVVQRLQRRLEQIGVVTPQDSEGTAKRIYEVSRNVAPGAVLRSLGIGTTVNEVVGLVATRFVIDQQFPVPRKGTSLVTWISFDEHHRWFGRGHKTRADLGRFVLTVQGDDTVRLDILVAESKFRQTYDVGSAKEQLNRTTDLCEDAFRSDGEARHDRPFWLDELAAAIAQTSGNAVQAADLPARTMIGNDDHRRVEAKVLDALRSEDVQLGQVTGVAVAISAEEDEPAPTVGTLGKHTLVRLNKNELLNLIGALRANQDPTNADPLVAPGNPTGTVRIPDTVVRTPSAVASAELPTSEEPTPPAEAAGAAAPTNVPSPATAWHSAEEEDPLNSHRGGLGEEELRLRYNKVVDVFARHRVAVTAPEVGKWQEGPGFYIFRFVPDPGVTVDKLTNRRDEIFLTLELPSGFSIRTRSDRGSVLFEIPKVDDEKYGVDAKALWKRCPADPESLIAPLGADIEGNPVTIDLSSADSPHLLVAGTTGSGKSVALDTILKGLVRYDKSSLRLRLVDPKGTELVDFEDDPHLDGMIGMDAADAIEILEETVEEMAVRYKDMKAIRTRKLVEYNAKVDKANRKPWIVIVLDEYADLTSDPDEKKKIEALLKRLTQKARAAGIHVIAATQRPSADVISTTIRSNFPAQLALRVKTATDSRIILDETGAEALAGQGDAILHTAKGTVRVQVAYDGS
ncbi:FtsK/SpoIIIE domain-containing protein [Streptomyces endophyticus]|uniref:FtsK/SpoIIIE domain-containing protein n=1 Tax=Streptomyces endophyticus TaxID=714166 RepID=A0ABU6FIV9_9ACTN|nr:FtsK/SpoIIIE domain-containing protein [Streptomyces endophyticus]MEB8343919.1 FtsK/SpoIIIE domain-containing protein [Streptomyces endophyticus]